MNDTATSDAPGSKRNPSGADWIEDLGAFSQAFHREAHGLLHRPDLLWQQLHNRLQWKKGGMADLLQVKAEQRSSSEATPWLKSRTPPRESEALLATYAGHSQQVRCCAVSSDGSYVVSGGLDGVHAWDLKTTRLRVEMEGSGPGSRIHLCCAISPNRPHVVSGDGEGIITLWSVESGRKLKAIRAHEGQVNACQFSPDGTVLVSCSNDGLVKVWDTGTWRLKSAWEGHEHWVNDCALSPDGTGVLSVGWDKTLRIWDFAHGERHEVMEKGSSSECCAFSADGRTVIAGEFGGLRLWRLARGRLKDARVFVTCPGPPIEHTDDIHACIVSPDGTWVAAARGDGTLSLWSVHHSRTEGSRVPGTDGVALQTSPSRSLVGHGGPVFCCAVTPDGSKLVTGSLDGTLKVWDAAREAGALLDRGVPNRISRIGSIWARRLLLTLRNEYGAPVQPDRPKHHTGWANDCLFSPDGTWVTTCGDDTNVMIWKAENGHWIKTLGHQTGFGRENSGHDDLVGGCAICGTGSVIASAGDDGFLVWDRTSGDVRRTLGESAGPGGGPMYGRSCAVSPNSAYVAVAPSLRDHLTVWRTVDGEEVAELKVPESEVTDCAWSRDGQFVISAHWDGALTTWEADTWEQLERLETENRSPAKVCAVSETADVMVSGDWEGILHVFDRPSGIERLTFQAHEGGVNDCAVSPTGNVAASVGKDGFLRIWDLLEGSERLAVPLQSEAGCVDLSSAESRVAIGDTAGDLHILDMVGFGYRPTSIIPHNLGKPMSLGVPLSRKERARWLRSMSLGHLMAPPAARPPLGYCLAALSAKALAHGTGLLLLLAGLSALLWRGGVESGVSIRLALAALVCLGIRLSLGMALLRPWKK